MYMHITYARSAWKYCSSGKCFQDKFEVKIAAPTKHETGEQRAMAGAVGAVNVELNRFMDYQTWFLLLTFHIFYFSANGFTFYYYSK